MQRTHFPDILSPKLHRILTPFPRVGRRKMLWTEALVFCGRFQRRAGLAMMFDEYMFLSSSLYTDFVKV